MNIIIATSNDAIAVAIAIGVLLLAIFSVLSANRQSRGKDAEILAIIPHVFEEVTRTCDGCINQFNSEIDTLVHNGKKPLIATPNYYAASTAAALFCLFAEYKKRQGAEAGHSMLSSMLQTLRAIAQIDSCDLDNKNWKQILDMYSMHVGTDIGAKLLERDIWNEDMFRTAGYLNKCAFRLVGGDESDIEHGCKRFEDTFLGNALASQKIVETIFE